MSLTLYQLTDEYQKLVDDAEHAESEELQAAFRDTLEGLTGEIGLKVLNCAAVVRTVEAHAVAVARECERLDKRRASLMNAAEHLKGYMQRGMEAAGQKKFQNELFSVCIRNNAPSVVLDATEIDRLPPQFVRVTKEPDKKAIAEALKNNVPLAFARLEVRKSLRIS